MTKFLLRNKAIDLRKKGKSYTEILKEIDVSKSTLSEWLRTIILSDKQISRLKTKKEKQIERYVSHMRKLRQKRLENYYKESISSLLPLSERELLLTGMFLYWGEGNKASRHNISINNTDPRLVLFAYYWLRNGLKIPKEKIKILLHLYSDMDEAKEINFWGKLLRVSKKQFNKSYIKKSTRVEIGQKGFGHGTCTIVTGNVAIKERMMMGLMAIADFYARKIPKSVIIG